MNNTMRSQPTDEVSSVLDRGEPNWQLYGRRVEADRSWTVYHVFSGVPARVAGASMMGLTWRTATTGMLSLNRESEARFAADRQQ